MQAHHGCRAAVFVSFVVGELMQPEGISASARSFGMCASSEKIEIRLGTIRHD
jgi:hypothetical protein